jgi:hypothetical protein
LRNKRAIPTDHKSTVVATFLAQRAGIGAKKAPPSAPPTNSTPPANVSSAPDLQAEGEPSSATS